MTKLTTRFIGLTTVLSLVALALVFPSLVTNAATTWDTTGDYIINMEYQGDDNLHDMTLVQDNAGNLTGNGGSPAGNNTYLWTITSGSVTENVIEFTADYTATQDAVDPQTTLIVNGIIAEDGTMSGTWSDNYQAGERSGTWSTTEGNAIPTESEMVTVTIDKYVDGVMATASTSDNADFPMTATFETGDSGVQTASYTLSETNTVPYQAMTSEMELGADYETNEILTGEVVAVECTEGKPFALNGYTTGSSHAEAMAATPSMTTPTFTDMQEDKYVIVWNTDCSNPDGDIGGEVVAGDGTLEVTAIEMIDTSATADGTFANGWEYVFHVTAPTSEQKLAMKFSDWMQTDGSGVIPVANNMRISSLQADNGGATSLLTAANVYSTPDLNMVTDLDPTMDGLQVEITVEVAVPNGTPNGAYTTSYGVRSNQ